MRKMIFYIFLFSSLTTFSWAKTSCSQALYANPLNDYFPLKPEASKRKNDLLNYFEAGWGHLSSQRSVIKYKLIRENQIFEHLTQLIEKSENKLFVFSEKGMEVSASVSPQDSEKINITWKNQNEKGSFEFLKTTLMEQLTGMTNIPGVSFDDRLIAGQALGDMIESGQGDSWTHRDVLDMIIGKVTPSLETIRIGQANFLSHEAFLKAYHEYTIVNGMNLLSPQTLLEELNQAAALLTKQGEKEGDQYTHQWNDLDNKASLQTDSQGAFSLTLVSSSLKIKAQIKDQKISFNVLFLDIGPKEIKKELSFSIQNGTALINPKDYSQMSALMYNIVFDLLFSLDELNNIAK